MKSDRFSYLELIVHHKDFSLYEYPSRFCIIRVSLDKIDIFSIRVFRFSLGQIRKLYKIGFFDKFHDFDSIKVFCLSNFDDFKVVGHRPFDRNYMLEMNNFDELFKHSAACFFRDYGTLFK